MKRERQRQRRLIDESRTHTGDRCPWLYNVYTVYIRRIIAKFHYTDPTGPDRTRTDFFAARVSEKLRWVRAGPRGSGRVRVVEFSLYRVRRAATASSAAVTTQRSWAFSVAAPELSSRFNTTVQVRLLAKTIDAWRYGRRDAQTLQTTRPRPSR